VKQLSGCSPDAVIWLLFRHGVARRARSVLDHSNPSTGSVPSINELLVARLIAGILMARILDVLDERPVLYVNREVYAELLVVAGQSRCATAAGID